jgi:hypothetical protein
MSPSASAKPIHGLRLGHAIWPPPVPLPIDGFPDNVSVLALDVVAELHVPKNDVVLCRFAVSQFKK